MDFKIQNLLIKTTILLAKERKTIIVKEHCKQVERDCVLQSDSQFD
jgi:hypothetical protein